MDDNYLDGSLDQDECIPSSMMLLLKNNIKAASIPDTNGQLPLHKALEKKSKWERGIKMLVNAAPNALCTRDKLSHLYPFMIAANKNSLDICYQLLLIRPEIVKIALNHVEDCLLVTNASKNEGQMRRNKRAKIF